MKLINNNTGSLCRNQLISTRNQQTGLTLVEIMVAITLSLFLLGGLVKIVVGNKQTYRVQDAMARVQENGRFSLHFLSKDIRMAGFMGCTNTNGGLDVTNNVAPAGTGANGYTTDLDSAMGAYDGTNSVEGYSYTTTFPTELSDLGLSGGSNFGNVMADTDIVVIRRASSCPGGFVTVDNSASAQMTIQSNATCDIQQDDIVMVSNCETADIFGVSNNPGDGAGANIAHAANWNTTPQFSNGYGADSFIYLMENNVFYIGVGSSGEPALFKRELKVGALTSYELVEGVEDMTILYGVDTVGDDGAADIYVNADAINAAVVADPTTVLNMENVVSLRITMTARSLEDNIATSTSNGDRRIRRTFSTTIGIRNRMS